VLFRIFTSYQLKNKIKKNSAKIARKISGFRPKTLAKDAIALQITKARE
jgi:hypothetical protein